nr:nuclear poly(A) polymerase 4-like isoform X2 [Ipomoea trifida]
MSCASNTLQEVDSRPVFCHVIMKSLMFTVWTTYHMQKHGDYIPNMVHEVTELCSVPDANVPVIKLNFDGVSIDLLIWTYPMCLLYNVDEPTAQSLNGCRVADQILKLVPNVEASDQEQMDTPLLIVERLF